MITRPRLARRAAAGAPGPATDAERLAAVAAAARAGASAIDAWAEWGGGSITVVDGVPLLERSDPLARDVVAAARLAHSSGVPLADLVSSLARVEAAREAAKLARDVALAGPRASARLLGWLPVAGLGLGTIVEPRTLGVLVATPLGWVLAVLATVLTVAGRAWMRALVRGATDAGVVL